MPPPNNPRTARIALIVDRDTRKFINTLHMARGDDGILALPDLTSMANVVADWWQNSYRHSCIPAVVGEQVTATKQDPSNPLQAVAFINGPGDVVSPVTEPGNVTAAVSWRTGLAGRKYRGRFYHVGFDGDQRNSNDTIQGAYLALLGTLAQYLLNHAATAALKLIIYHKVGDTYTDINTVITDQNLDSQRRRLPARGI